MRRLKVLFLTSWYPTRELPVEGVFVREHAKAVQLYDDVVVLHCAGFKPGLRSAWQMEQEIDQDLTEGIPTYRVWHRRSPVPKTSYPLHLWSIWQASRRIVAQYFRPDIVHGHVYTAGVCAVLLGKRYSAPVLVTEHSSAFARKLLRGPAVWQARFALEKADVVLPVSRALQQAIEAYGIKSQFRVVPNAVDTCLFSPDFNRSGSGAVKRLLVVGLFDASHNKGIPYLFHALAKLKEQRKDWHLDIVGEGPPRAEYERLSTELGIADRVTFHGLKAKSEVAVFMRQADLFVLPSLFETFSVASTEALATGVPVLATRCGGPEEFITGDLGMTVAAGDAGALSEALNHMLDHLHLYSRTRIAQYAKEHFSPEQVGTLLHTIYESLYSTKR